MSVKNRILEFIRYRDMAVSQFESLCGLSNGYISSMRLGFGTRKLENVLNYFSDLSREWLLYGEGEMLKPQAPSIANSGIMDISGRSNKIHNVHSNDSGLGDKAEIKRLKEIITEKSNLIDEKERLIAEKERTISLLINQPKPLP